MRRLITLLLITLATLSGTYKLVLAESIPILKITIQTKQVSIKDGDIFPVTTIIQNIGKDVSTLHLWICSYDEHWITDTPKVNVLEIPCDKNFIQKIKLEPGEYHKRELYLRANIVPKSPPMEMPSIRSISFRLGFTDGREAEHKESAKSIWSNSITLKVVK